MSQSELSSLLRADLNRIKIGWEQTRLVSFYTMISQYGTKKIKKPTDLFRFPWEKKEEKKSITPQTSKEDLKKIVEEVKQHLDG